MNSTHIIKCNNVCYIDDNSINSEVINISYKFLYYIKY